MNEVDREVDVDVDADDDDVNNNNDIVHSTRHQSTQMAKAKNASKAIKTKRKMCENLKGKEEDGQEGERKTWGNNYRWVKCCATRAKHKPQKQQNNN